MTTDEHTTVQDVLLTRRGVVCVESESEELVVDLVRAVELELAEIGYVLSERLRARLSRCLIDELTRFHRSSIAALLAHVGGNQKHEPLFRQFPKGVPDDTLELWWKKVLVFYLQSDDQPCLFCRRTGTTHVLQPCRHIVCDHCFDGSNYSACPVCECRVDRESPFFKELPERELPKERVVFKLLDLGESIGSEAKALLVSLCERTQALSPVDRSALSVVLREFKSQALEWLPSEIPLRENIATVFGTLFHECEPDTVLQHARRYIGTATDVLRFIAVMSGTDGSLLRETQYKEIEYTEEPSRFWGEIAKLLHLQPPSSRQRKTIVPLRVSRFKVVRMPRRLRRALLGLLEEMDPILLTEDMLRHRSYWVWIGQFLHPHEYAARFPKVCEAFRVVRKKAPDGTPAPEFRNWYSRLDQALQQRDADAMIGILTERPGEFARRLDHAMRTVSQSDADVNSVTKAFVELMPKLATPVLLTLRSHLPKRYEKAQVRVYWPKGRVAKGVSTEDTRSTLSVKTTQPVVQAIESELLRRFADKPRYGRAVIDERLKTVIVPFNERTASASAISLPRGSQIPVPTGKTIRLFLHWCQPEKGGQRTDLDLSVAFYDSQWQYLGVCSYYELKLKGQNRNLIAQSAGDLQNAPWPDGATEFIDIHREEAAANGARYAVMVVNAYVGMPFSLLERGFAGMMLRDDTGGKHFDPRTVELKFALDGENGVFMPLVLDIQDEVLHWLDVQSKGEFEMNNVETSNAAITKICPDLITYFGSGVRPTMYELSLLHAAARCDHVILRGEPTRRFARRADEGNEEFHSRLVNGEPDDLVTESLKIDGSPDLAILFRGDLDLPQNSSVYALFREQAIPNLAASDLLT